MLSHKTLNPATSLTALLLTLLLVAASCTSSDSGTSTNSSAANASGLKVEAGLASKAVETYAAGVHASYEASLSSAKAMDTSIAAFVADPTQANLDAAKQSWLDAREDYGPTEVFRFYEGPIDNEATGKEGLINAWPLDEAFIDYVEGGVESGIINNSEDFPTIDKQVLLDQNENGGESNISTGWHAIEFLLWGQDLNAGDALQPGSRPVSDYTTARNAERRGTYLATASALLIEHLQELVAAWASNSENYRKEFVALDPAEALTKIVTGMGELSGFELSSERMNVAYSERSQEDEHSCFSDNTHNDIIGNAVGVQRVYDASYPGGIEGTSIYEVLTSADVVLADELKNQIDNSVLLAKAIPAPFDQHLAAGISDDQPGRQAILATIQSLDKQTETMVAAAAAIGIKPKLTE